MTDSILQNPPSQATVRLHLPFPPYNLSGLSLLQRESKAIERHHTHITFGAISLLFCSKIKAKDMVGLFSRFSVSRNGHRRSQSALVSYNISL